MVDNTIQILEDNGYIHHRMYIYKKNNIKVHLGKSLDINYNDCWKCVFFIDDDIENSQLVMNNEQLIQLIKKLDRDNIIDDLFT